MSGLLFTYRYPGPPSQGVLIKNRGNNAIVDVQMGMPQKFSPSAGDSMFSNARKAYVKDSGGGTLLAGHYDSSQHIALKKLNAIGKGSTLKSTVSFQGQAQKQDSYRNSALARVRGGGTVAPKKKGALANPFKSGGGSSLTGSGNRQIFAVNPPLKPPSYTISEIAEHDTIDKGVWIAYKGKVYDITTSKFDLEHIHKKYWGTDITVAITNSHSSKPTVKTPDTQQDIEAMLKSFFIGYLK